MTPFGHLSGMSTILTYRSYATAAVVIAMTALLIRSQRHISDERTRLSTALAAAREVQQKVVPLNLPQIAGMHLEATYLPAEEVGGDFYQLLPQAEGSTLIAIGDVSGKGIHAAMTGVLAIGALRTLASEGLSPAALLVRLNQQLVGAQQGGFITCLCVRVAEDGTLTLANAGHLAPYLNGDEVALESSLPLGLTSDAIYTETTLNLAPRDTLTFLSDGVVEAQSATGELFGFDRTREVSTQSAQQIAAAAQQFGQQDDIMVLTLTFTPAELLHV